MKTVRGIVLKINKKHLILLTKDEGSFVKVPHPGGSVRVGDDVSCRIYAPIWSKAVAVAACLAVAIIILSSAYSPGVPFWGWWDSSETAHGFIVFDINPSFELVLDQKLQVIAINDFNEDAVLLIEDWPEGDQLYAVLEWLLERAVHLEYLAPELENNLVSVTLVQLEDSTVSPRQLADFIEEQLSRSAVYGYVAVFTADRQAREEARDAGMSLNRYQLIKVFPQQIVEDALKDLPLIDLILELNDKFPGTLFRAFGKPEEPKQQLGPFDRTIPEKGPPDIPDRRNGDGDRKGEPPAHPDAPVDGSNETDSPPRSPDSVPPIPDRP